MLEQVKVLEDHADCLSQAIEIGFGSGQSLADVLHAGKLGIEPGAICGDCEAEAYGEAQKPVVQAVGG